MEARDGIGGGVGVPRDVDDFHMVVLDVLNPAGLTLRWLLHCLQVAEGGVVGVNNGFGTEKVVMPMLEGIKEGE